MALEDILARAEQRRLEEQNATSDMPTQGGIDRILSRAAERRDTSEKGRSFAQGLTFGFADEIEALARSAVESGSYEEIRDQIRQKLAAYQQAHPYEAISMEMLGAAAPTAVALMTGFGAPVAQQSLGRLAGRAALIGTGEGALTAYGTGEKGMVEDIARIPTGAAVGGFTGGVLAPTLAGSGTLLNKVIDAGRSVIGDRAGTPVQAEVNRLVQETGLSADQVINDLMDGRLMTENPELIKSLQAYRAAGGKAGAQITETLERRARQTQSQSIDDLQRGLAPQAGDNVYRTIRLGEQQFKQKQSNAYNQIFAQGQPVSREMTSTLSEALVRMPDAAAEIGKIYQSRGNLVPFFKVNENGALQIVRQPTVEDAEIIRRALAEATSKAYKDKSGSIGEALGDLERSLRKQLDDEAPDLAATRQNWANLNTARDAFDTGRKILTGDLEEKLFTIQQAMARGNEGEIKALRAGFMNQLKNKFARQGTVARRLADQDSAEGQIFRELYPDGFDADRVIKNLETAAIARQVKQSVAGGSPTAPMQSAMSRIGTNVSAGDVQGAMVGHMPSLARIAQGMVRSISPDLSPRQREQVVGIIMTEDPDILRRAINDDTALATVQRRISAIMSGGSQAAQKGLVRQAAEQGGTLGESLFGDMLQP